MHMITCFHVNKYPCHSLANQEGACQRPAATKQAHVQQLVVLQAP